MKAFFSKSLLVITLLFIFETAAALSQIRIAVLPFQNKDGKLSLNVLSYKLGDSLTTAYKMQDLTEKYFRIVPMDSIEGVLAQMNLDPTNPQYQSDVWKAIVQLNIKYVILGNFNIESDKFLINAYIYDAKTKLAVPEFQARDIFLKEENIMESIPEIIDDTLPFFIKK